MIDPIFFYYYIVVGLGLFVSAMFCILIFRDRPEIKKHLEVFSRPREYVVCMLVITLFWPYIIFISLFGSKGD